MRQRLTTLSWAGAALSLACASAGPEPASKPSDPSAAQSADDSAEDGTADAHSDSNRPVVDGVRLPPGREVSFAEELREVEKLRGLSIQRPLRGRTISTEALLDHMKASFRADTPPAIMEGSEDQLIAMGVVPYDFKMEAAVLAMLGTDLAGLYDPRFGTMFLRQELDGAMRRATLLHELVHALQDQNFGLEEVSLHKDDSGDERSALVALAEGDATSLMFDAMLVQLGKTALDLPEETLAEQFAQAAAGKEDDATPALLRRSMLSPYADGLVFVHKLRRRGGFAEVDRVFRNPPTTTEQLLHLDKYDSHEPAVPVALPLAPPALPSAPFQMTYHDIVGEQSIRIWLEEWLPPAEAAEAARAWGGDRVAVFARGEERALNWVIQSDNEERARALYEALVRGLGARAIVLNPGAEPSHCALRPERGALAIARKGARVVVTAGPYFRAPGASPSAPKPDAQAACKTAQSWLKLQLSAR